MSRYWLAPGSTTLTVSPTAVASGGDLPCDVAVTVSVENGRPVCDAVYFVRRDGEPPLTPHRIRLIPLADIVERSYRLVLVSPFRPQDEKHGATLQEIGEQRKRWRRGETQYVRLTDAFLRRVAAVYKREDQPKGRPTLAVAKELDRNFAKNGNTKTAQRWVAAARARGILERAPASGRWDSLIKKETTP